MKKVVLASLLTLACAAYPVSKLYAQEAAASTGQVQMSQEEYAAYNSANTQATPAAKAAAFEAYLEKYPKSAVKVDVLNQLVFLYSQLQDEAKTLDAANRLLAVDPSNLRALTLEVYYGRADADKMTDPAAKTAALDKVAGFAQTGLDATKPKGTSDADFAKLKAATEPTFESAIADDDMSKKDNAAAIKALKTELDANVATTQQVGPVLQDVFTLAQAYYTSTPPDYLDCAWYAARAGAFAPEPYKTTINNLGTYCYEKFHGNKDGYPALVTMTQTTLDPPANLTATVTPAPKPEDIVAQTVASTPDLATLAISDKEFMLQYGVQKDPKTETKDASGKPDPTTGESYADEVFDTVKGKSTQFPQVMVLDGSTADVLKVAVTDDAKTTKTADFTFQMKKTLTDVPATGTLVDIEGTYGSYTSSPMMITMTDGALIVKKPAKPAARHTTRRRSSGM